MNYAQNYLGKPLGEITYADVERFFASEQTESDQIEFKSCNPNGAIEGKLPGIIEGITAFLNSSGGLLIWGAPEGVKLDGRKEKIFMGGLTQVPLSVEKDWLISKIADKIIPLPNGFRAQLVPGLTSQVVVFEVDGSNYAPHQTGNVYYMRIDGQNKPAPHHYIEALFNKVSFPRIEAYIKISGIDANEKGVLLSFDIFFFNFSPFLNEERFYYKIKVEGGIFSDAMGAPGYSHMLDALSNARYDNNGSELRSNAHNVSISIPLVYGEPEHLMKQFYFPFEKKNGAITLYFSGKTTPMKSCRYTINFEKIMAGKIVLDIDYENQLMSERQAQLGVSETDMLSRFKVLRKKS